MQETADIKAPGRAAKDYKDNQLSCSNGENDEKNISESYEI